MSLPVQMAMKQSALNPPALPIQQQMHIMPHPQAQVPAPMAPASERLLVLFETTSATWLAIGSLAESLGDLEKAILLYDAALRHSPNNPEALTRLANIYRSRDHFMKAAELYKQALNFNPENGDTWGLLGHCYLMMDDLQRAYAAYQRALYYLDNPNVPKLWHGIGILYDRYGLLEYAEEAFVRVLDLDPNFDKSNEIHFRLGIIYKHQGKLASALECFQYILTNPPHPLTQPDVWFQIGSVLEQQKNWNSAKEAYEKVLEVNPNHAKVLQQLGCLYSQAEPASAQPGQKSPLQPFQQDLDIALKYLSQSIEIDSSDAHSWYYLGRVHMIRGDFNAAYEAFQQAVNRDSRNPTFWCSIGVLYYQISQYRDALDAYTRAIRLNPYISEVWYDLGTLYETCNNQISDALDAYSQAERLDPGNPHIKARLEQLIKYQQEGNTHPPQPPPVSQQPRLPQGMVLESTQALPQQQQPQQQPPSGPQQLHHDMSARVQKHPSTFQQPLHQGPTPAANPAAAVPVGSSHPGFAGQAPRDLAAPGVHGPQVPQAPPSAAKPETAPPVTVAATAAANDTKPAAPYHVPAYTNGKHDLEDKADDKQTKKPLFPSGAESEKTISPAASKVSPGPAQAGPAATALIAAPAATTTSAAATTAAAPSPVVSYVPAVAPAAPSAMHTPTPPAGGATPAVEARKQETFNYSTNGEAKDDYVEEEEKTEPVEPPMRNVDEDENYDDE